MENTINRVLDEVTKKGRPLSRRQFYRFAKELEIQPLGTRQRPQRWPADTAIKIIVHLGLGEAAPKGRIFSMAEIKRKAGRKGAKR